jgi:hypothetical protein
LFLASAISAGLSVPQYTKARRAPYYILRRKALQQANRWVLVAVVMLILAILMLFLAPHLASIPLPLPAPTATPTSTPAPTSTPRPTHTPTATPTRRPTATPPLIPTSTPAVPPPDELLTPMPSAMPAGESARIELQAVALERNDSGQPVNPGDEFPPGDHRVYLFFTWEGMQNGNATAFLWYKDGELLDFCSDTWLWGLVEGRDWGERGRTSYYCRLPAGWQPGDYAIHVFIENRLQGIARFAITEE